MTEDLFPPGLEPPSPPPDLRSRVLEAASRAFDAPRTADPWARALRSPALRLAWAASIAALAASHLLLPPRRTRTEDPQPPEIRQLARLPRIDSHALPAEGSSAPAANEERS